MEKSFGLLFYFKKNRCYNESETPIYIRITVNSAIAEVSTKRKCDALKSNAAADRAEGTTEFAKSINGYLEVVQQKVYELRKQLESGQAVTAENLKTLLQDKASQ